MTDRMYDSAEAFARALDKLVDQAQDHASEIIRKSLIDTTQNIIDDTPVDTGRLRAGWHLDTNFDSDDVPPEGQESYPKPETQDPGHNSDWQWEIFNNLEYCTVIEDGWSRQAPQGMVAVNLQAFADHVNKYAKQDDYWEPS
jgi:hypothetical protein